MPAKRELSMRQLRHLLRLHHDGVSAREIGRRLGVARSTIQDNLGRARAAGIGRSCGTARSLRARRRTWPHVRTGGRDRLHRWLRLIRPRIEARKPAVMRQRRFPI